MASLVALIVVTQPFESRLSVGRFHTMNVAAVVRFYILLDKLFFFETILAPDTNLEKAL